MALFKILFRPGIAKQFSKTTLEGGWWDSNRVRFRDGIPEKMAGWQRVTEAKFRGSVRCLSQNRTLLGDPYLVSGASSSLQIFKGGVVADITPILKVVAENNAVSVVNGSSVATITTALASGAVVGDYISLSSVTVGGLTLLGDYRVDATPTVTSFLVTAVGTASSTVSNSGGALTVTYYLPSGLESASFGLGWGAGPWGFLEWGTPRVVSTVTLSLRTWSISSWGQDIIANPSQGELYLWQPDVLGNVTTRAAPIINSSDGTVEFVTILTGGSYTVAPIVTFSPPASGVTALGTVTLIAGSVYEVEITDPGSGYTAPPTVTFSGGVGTGATASATLYANRSPPKRIGLSLVAPTERHVILFGASSLASADNYDPLLIRWSDVENYTDYLAQATNSAGSFRVTLGTQIVGAYNANLQTLIWTDTSMYLMRFVGGVYIYSLQPIGQSTGLISQYGFIEASGVVYWMGSGAFYAYTGGGPQILPCSLHEEVFHNINPEQKSKITCGRISAANEVIWFYPSKGSLENDRYICYNFLEKLWYGGSLERTFWLDADIYDNPYAVGGDGTLFQQESGSDDDGQPMGEFLQSGYVKLDAGDDYIYCDGIIPDFMRLEAEIYLTIETTDYPNRPPYRTPRKVITSETEYPTVRARGRLMAIRLEGGGVNSSWRLGQINVNISRDGSR